MRKRRPPRPGMLPVLGVLALACLSWSAAFAQAPVLPDDSWQPDAGARNPASVPPRPRFFRMPLDLRRDAPDPSPGNRLQVQFGEDNPFFDLRKPGDPGGVGYQKLNTQLQLLDNGTSGLVVGFQAVKPSGLEYDGLNDGPTVVSPALGVVQGLGEGTALQGFVGKDVRPGPGWTDDLDRNLQYGMVLQTPLPGVLRNPGQGVYLFVEALGRYRHDSDANRTATAVWEVLPGLHWRGRDNWWMSGGVLLPVGPGRPESGLMQITYSRQF